MGGSLIEKLLVYGPLGIGWALFGWALIQLFRSKEKAAKEHREALERLNKDHRQELNALRDKHEKAMDLMQTRHITKAENWVEKGNALSANISAVLDSVVRRNR